MDSSVFRSLFCKIRICSFFAINLTNSSRRSSKRRTSARSYFLISSEMCSLRRSLFSSCSLNSAISSLIPSIISGNSWMLNMMSSIVVFPTIEISLSSDKVTFLLYSSRFFRASPTRILPQMQFPFSRSSLINVSFIREGSSPLSTFSSIVLYVSSISFLR